MDLLGGYDSNGSSSTTTTCDDDNDEKDCSSPKVNVTVTSQTQIPNDTEIERKRRFLRLNAVLPLARSNAKDKTTTTSLNRRPAGGGYSSDSSDFSNDKSRIQPVAKRQRRVPPPSKSKSSSSTSAFGMTREDDAGISSLLSDLMGIAPTTNLIAPSLQSVHTSADTTTTANDMKGERLGMAFMNVTSTTITRKKRNGATSTTTSITNHTPHSKNIDALGSSSTATASGRSMGVSTAMTRNDRKQKDGEIIVEDVYSDEERQVQEETSSRTALILKPEIQQKLTTPHPQKATANRSLGLRRGMDAAPRVVPTISSTNMQDRRQQQQQHQQQQQQQHHHQQQQQQIPQISRNKSRRELEKALRSGNFSSIDEATTTDITQKIYNPNNHESIPTNGQLLATSTAQEYTGTNFHSAARNLPTYVPQECGTSTEHSEKMTAKHKSKHQIHSLVTNAKNLEAQRFRMGVMGGAKKGSSSRADAKKKYGW